MEKIQITQSLKLLLKQLQDQLNQAPDLSPKELGQYVMQLHEIQEKLRDLKYISSNNISPEKTELPQASTLTQTPNSQNIIKEIKVTVPPTPEKTEAPAKEVKPLHEVIASNKTVEVNAVVQKKTFALDLNDRIYIQRELFNNDSEMMREFMDKLTFEGDLAQKLLLVSKQEWNMETEPVKRFVQIIETTFA